MANAGSKEINEKQMLAYIGLELAMSIVQLNTIKHYWATEPFLGCVDFQNVMSRDEFLSIRYHVKFVPQSHTNNSELATVDPLWH